MQLEILTPDQVLFSGDVVSAVLPGSKGQFEILQNHAALVSSLEKGLIRVKTTDGKSSEIAIQGGVVEVLNNKIVVLA
ncbi:MAG: ATP synthase F1 subunit epsilon [Bacteroidia bacterium]|nr:ATP synthase F1 subunit epsilon [Bacteroidia bacterium]MCC7533144.1 ATP synthase F1 subunit epsilon [Bacteroidia bacterium]MCZ2141507.1 ATP synthase F1 subunit epsilon [Bacteroidia bacterium]